MPKIYLRVKGQSIVLTNQRKIHTTKKHSILVEDEKNKVTRNSRQAKFKYERDSANFKDLNEFMSCGGLP
jgi:hypothetical protein